jgi:excisionase family DNA binding protein
MARPIDWMSTKEASARLGVTLRSLYRFIDEGALPAYRFGRVIRLKLEDVDRFIEQCRIAPGSLEHLYPELKHGGGAADAGSALGDRRGDGGVGTDAADG